MLTGLLRAATCATMARRSRPEPGPGTQRMVLNQPPEPPADPALFAAVEHEPALLETHALLTRVASAEDFRTQKVVDGLVALSRRGAGPSRRRRGAQGSQWAPRRDESGGTTSQCAAARGTH
jgi:hypothetical protein